MKNHEIMQRPVNYKVQSIYWTPFHFLDSLQLVQ